jgi:hypothetical protein
MSVEYYSKLERGALAGVSAGYIYRRTSRDISDRSMIRGGRLAGFDA